MVALYTLVRREIARFLRIWTQTLLPPAITMALYFFIFGNIMGPRIGPMGGHAYIEYLAPGLIMMSIITNAYANVVASFFGAKFQRHLEEMLVAPMSNLAILSGFIIGGVVRGICVGVIVLVIALLFTNIHIQHPFFTFMVAMLTALLFAFAGFLNGIFAKKFDDINIVPTFILTPLSYLGGIFYSVALLPAVYQKIMHFNPIFYMVNAFRWGMLGASDVSAVYSVIMLVVMNVILLLLSYILMEKGIGLKN